MFGFKVLSDNMGWYLAKIICVPVFILLQFLFFGSDMFRYSTFEEAKANYQYSPLKFEPCTPDILDGIKKYAKLTDDGKE